MWALCASALQLGCPQLLDEDFASAAAGGSGGANPSPDTTAPTVLESTPGDGARGVASDAAIEITFSEPMNTRATEAAYSSRTLPAEDVAFRWRDDDSVLVITPDEPLGVASGLNLALIEAQEYGLELSAEATDRAGNPIVPFAIRFAAVRELTQVILANTDRQLSGNWRSDASYGIEVCEEGDATICVGDSASAGTPTYRGFASFDLSPLPTDLVSIRAATLSLTISIAANDPFQTLGALGLEKIRFASIGTPAFEQAADASLGTLATEGSIGQTLSADVLSAVRADAAGGLSQYRLRFERDSVDDGSPNVVVFDLAFSRLIVISLVP